MCFTTSENLTRVAIFPSLLFMCTQMVLYRIIELLYIQKLFHLEVHNLSRFPTGDTNLTFKDLKYDLLFTSVLVKGREGSPGFTRRGP